MARPSHEDRRNAEDTEAELEDLVDDEPDDDGDADNGDADEGDADEGDADNGDAHDDGQRDAHTEELWSSTRIDPVEISLPTGTGYTLRAYRPSVEVQGPDVQRAADDDPFEELRAARLSDDTSEFDELAPDDADDEEVVAREERRTERRSRRTAAHPDAHPDARDDETDDDESDGDHDLDEAEEDEPADETDEDDEADEDDETVETEDVPVFLGQGGKLLLFRSPESLVEFVRSGAQHDLTQLDSWAEVVEKIRPEDVAPTGDDTYELDLVVENLRGGHDAWDAELLIGAGEIARDLGYALRFEPVLVALSPGSPLDDLDEALRSTVTGGLGGFFARRKLRKIGAQQATLGWRTIIGKISGVVDWRD